MGPLAPTRTSLLIQIYGNKASIKVLSCKLTKGADLGMGATNLKFKISKQDMMWGNIDTAE